MTEHTAKHEANVRIHLDLDVAIQCEFTTQEELALWLTEPANLEIIATTIAARLEHHGNDAMESLGWMPDDNREVWLGEITSHVTLLGQDVRPIIHTDSA